MSTYFISMVKDASAEIPLTLATGNTEELRVQSEVPDTTLTVTNSNVISAEIVDGPALKITALEDGNARVRINSGGSVTFRVTVEPQASGLRWIPGRSNALANVVTPLPGPGDSFPPGSVDGPNQTTNGAPYWLQRDMQDRWYIWWDVDTDPGPDIKKRLARFLADESIEQAYRDDVLARASELGYTT